MNKIILIFALCLISLNSFSAPFGLERSDSDDADKAAKISNLEEVLNQAEGNASIVGRKILETSRIMIVNQEIILGSCWDFINAVYNRAGFFSNSRTTIFKSKLQGPYAVKNRIEAGDWLYFINHSYGNVEHSGVFVAWMDPAQKEALIISYAGGNQAKPGRYKTYDLKSVYNIIRPR